LVEPARAVDWDKVKAVDRVVAVIVNKLQVFILKLTAEAEHLKIVCARRCLLCQAEIEQVPQEWDQ
jgi:hypothetical protein